MIKMKIAESDEFCLNTPLFIDDLALYINSIIFLNNSMIFGHVLVFIFLPSVVGVPSLQLHKYIDGKNMDPLFKGKNLI